MLFTIRTILDVVDLVAIGLSIVRLLFSVSVLFEISFLKTSPQSKVVKDNRACDGHIETGDFLGVLWDVDKVIAGFDLVLVKTQRFISKHKNSLTFEGLLVDRFCTRPDLDAANADVSVLTVFLDAL